MGKKIIEILDAVHAKANPEARQSILKYLRYKSTFMKQKWIRNKYKKAIPIREKETKTCHLITGRNNSSGTFLVGSLPTIIKKEKDIKIIGKLEKLIPNSKKPSLPNITFRKDQLKALRKMRIKQRGLVVFPTGSGKTILALGFMSMFPEYRILFLCHTTELVRQTSEELNKFNMNHYILGDGNKVNWESINLLPSCILVSTIQSFSKVEKKYWIGFFDITLIDEVHHSCSEKTQYGKIMLHNLSPIKIGFTATTPTTDYEKICGEGFFGPTIAELTNKEGEEIGIIAKAKVNIIPVPYRDDLYKKTRITYKEIYDLGIVNNKDRNNLILEASKKSISKKEIILIIVEKIEHGEVLKKLFKKNKIECPFVQGKSESIDRSKVKNELKEGKRNIAICTRVWKEGINIPSLNHIILASGMKEEKSIKQAMGRGLRTTKTKSKIKLTDFLDPYPYLAQHSIVRYSIYKKLGWIK